MMNFWEEETQETPALPDEEALEAAVEEAISPEAAPMSVAEIQGAIDLPPNISIATASAIAAAVMSATQGDRGAAEMMLAQVNLLLSQVNSPEDAYKLAAIPGLDTAAIERELEATASMEADLTAVLGTGGALTAGAVAAGNPYFALLGNRQKQELDSIFANASEEISACGHRLEASCSKTPDENLDLAAAQERGHGVNAASPTAGRGFGIA
jgi:hypothetical protein